MKNLLPLLAILGLAGCRAFDPALLNPVPGPLPGRLPLLVAELQTKRWPAGLDSQAVAADLRVLFAREVGEVLAAPASPPQGFAVLTTRCVSYHEGWAYNYVSGLTLGGLTLLGFPWARYRCTVEVHLDVRNRHRELVGTYFGQGYATATGGLYSRTNYAQPGRVLYLQGVRQGLSQIIPQLRPEIVRLQQELAP